MQPPPYGSVPSYSGLRPLGVGEIIDRSIQVYRKNFVALATMVVVTVVPIAVVTLLINLSARPARNESTTTIGGIRFGTPNGNGHDAQVQFAASIAVILLSLIASRLAIGACTRGVADAYLGGVTTDARASLRVFGRALPSLLWIELLVVPACLVASVFCIAPGVWLWISWLVTAPALLVEGVRGTSALRRSFRLVRPRWWPTFGLAIVAYLLTEVVRFSFGLLLVFVILASHSAASTSYIVVAGLIGAISSVLTTPLIASIYVILYFDLRVRSEGLDLQLVLEGLDSPATPTIASPAPVPAPGSWGPPTGGPPPPPPPPPPPFRPPPPRPGS
jgi:hypothetical protein